MKSVVRFAVASAGVVALALGVSSAGQTPAVILACVNSVSREVRIVSSGEACRMSETPMSWQAAGLPGEPGVPGAPGDPGQAGPAGPGSLAYYAEQLGTVRAAVVSDWVDVIGAAVAFTTDTDATLDLVANGAMTGVFGSSPWVRCAMRFVVDGTAGGDPTYGDMIVSPGRTESGAAEWTSFTLTRRVSVGPGPHIVRTELTKALTGFASDLSCQIDGPAYSGVRLHVTVR